MDQQHYIITIGRQIGSGGRVIARYLADNLGFRFYDKEILNLAARESGFKEQFFEQNDETKGFLKNMFHFHVPLLGSNNFYPTEFSQEGLYKFQSDAVLKAARAGNCVFVGRTADYILRNEKNVLNIFITANIDHRLQRVCKRKGCTRAEARKLLHDKEESRATYYNYYTGKQWGHSESYDLCINSSLLGIEETERFLLEFVKRYFKIQV